MLERPYVRCHLYMHVCERQAKGDEDLRFLGNNVDLEFSEETWAKQSKFLKRERFKVLLW